MAGFGGAADEGDAASCRRRCRGKAKGKARRDCLNRCRAEPGGCSKLDQLCGPFAGTCCKGRCIGRVFSTCQFPCSDNRECWDNFPEMGFLVHCVADEKCISFDKCCVNIGCAGISRCPDPNDERCCLLEDPPSRTTPGVCCFPGQICVLTQGCFWI